MMARVATVLGFAIGVATTASGCGVAGSPLSSWDAIEVSISASDDENLIDDLRVTDRIATMSDSHGTADACPVLGDDVQVSIGGDDVGENVLRGGDVPVDNGEIDLRPDFMKEKQCGTVSALQTRPLDDVLASDDITFAGSDGETRTVNVPGIGKSAHLVPQFDATKPLHAGDVLTFLLATPVVNDVNAGSSFSSTDDSSVDANAVVSVAGDGDGQQVTLRVPAEAVGHVQLLVSMDWTMPCGPGFTTCTAGGSTSWSRTVTVQ